MVDIELAHCEEPAALAAIARLRETMDAAVSMAEELEAAVEAGVISARVLARHTKWCDTATRYTAGMEPARQAARSMYGFVPARLLDESNTPVAEYDDLLAGYRRRIAL